MSAKNTETRMNLLELDDYAILAIINKLNLVDRINLSRTHIRLSPLCFEGSWLRKSTETLTLNELRQLYEQSKTENEWDQCFKFNVFDRLMIKNFNEVVRLYMDPKYEQFVANDRILHSLERNFVLEKEEEKFCYPFVDVFLSLLKRVEGTLLLAFVDVEDLEEEQTEYVCTDLYKFDEILSDKVDRGQNVYCVDYCKTISWGNSLAWYINNNMDNSSKFTIYYESSPHPLPHILRQHCLSINKRNSVANTKELIAMINADSLIEAKQCLGKLLVLVEAEALRGGGREIRCGNCNAGQYSNSIIDPMDERMTFCINEPDWSNCADCAFK